jgi:molecular chaperone GrpE
MTQNTQTKIADESPVYIDEVDLFRPVEDETAHLREELVAERDKLLRLAAEYENYRRRTKQESEKAADEGKRELLMRMLSIADELDLAAGHLDETSDTVAEGLKLVRRRFDETLQANSVIPFKSKGEIFNPEIHEAFDVASDTKSKPGTVYSEIRRGYFWNNKLLRPALVVVAQ